MRIPRAVGTPIDAARMTTWIQEFGDYRYPISQAHIQTWLTQFAVCHQDLAARTLDCVQFITHERIECAYRTALNQIPGWTNNISQLPGRWRFAPFSTGAGESGDRMLHTFRMANGLRSNKYSRMFIYRSQLMSENLTSNDTIIFVDDFSGSGSQAVDFWTNVNSELILGDFRTYLVLVASTEQARNRLAAETQLQLVSDISLDDSDCVFDAACVHFPQHDKDILLQYGRLADRRRPQGFGDCGLLIVFAYDCPNNSIPLLHANNRRWKGLFRRN